MIHISNLDQLFEQFNEMRIMIVGDVMVDAYIWGKVDRISPEAPVPVVNVVKRANRLGGAANVGLNLKAMGAKPIICAVTGNDLKGQEFHELLMEAEMPTHGIIQSNTRPTTTKFRVIGNNFQLIRVDEEHISDLDETEESLLMEKIDAILSQSHIDGIILQDYNKGVLSHRIISWVLQQAKEKNIPVSADPKKKNFESYRGVSLFKPNLKELKEGMKLDRLEQIHDIEKALALLQQRISARWVLATLSEKGVLIRDEKGINHHIPAHIRDIADVSGAGDTVISVAALCLAAETDPETLAALSNLAGGLVCEEVGVVPINKNKLYTEVLKLLSL